MNKTKYICHKCGHVFDEDDMGSHSEWIGESRYSSNNSGWYTTGACPKCGCDDIRDAEECCCCGECFDKEEMIEADDNWYCKECAGRVYDAYYLAWGRFEEAKGAKNG